MCAAHYTTQLNLTQCPNRLVKEHNWVTYCGDLLTLPRGGPRLSGVRLPGAGDPGVANENQCNVIGCEREAGDVSNHLNHLNVTFKFLHLFGWGMISPLQQACYSWLQKVFIFFIFGIQKTHLLRGQLLASYSLILSASYSARRQHEAQRILPGSNNWPITHLYSFIIEYYFILFICRRPIPRKGCQGITREDTFIGNQQSHHTLLFFLTKPRYK